MVSLSQVRKLNRVLAELSETRSRRFSTARPRITGPFSNPRLLHDSIRELHGHFIRTHQHKNPNTMSQVIKSYSLSPASIDKARSAFLAIDNPTLPVWNHMIRGLAHSDRPADALDLFDRMTELGLSVDNLTLIFLCKACSRVSDVLYGRRVHTRALKLGFGSYLYVCNSLIHMYGCCGDLGSSRRVFDEMDDKDLVSWNSLLCAYSQCAKYHEVLALFDGMRVENVKADAVTMVKVILACNYLGESRLVDSLVEYIENNCVEIDVYLGNTLIDVYGNRGSFVLARSIFDRITEKNTVSWNAMIIAAAKSGQLVEAKKLFDGMPHKDVISWTSMITGYSQANRHDDAITLFLEMVANKIKPDQVTLAGVLSACAHVGRLDVGKAIHDHIRENTVKPDIYVANALMDMYCKCGSIGNALKVFHNTKEKDSVSWTSVISGLAVNGDSQHALELFSQMLSEGVRPIHGTFVGILLACVHSGLVDKGLHFFGSMQKDHGLVPEMRHYGCMVDLFCRAGYLSRAYEFIKKMPITPDAVLWRMLLSACKIHDDLVLAKIAFRKLLELDPDNGLNYVLTSNSYASAGRWEDASKMRELMDAGDILMPLGWSCIEATHEIAKTPQETNVLVMGAGPIGLVTMLAAHAFGAPRIIIVDADDHRLTVAKELGADETIKISTETNDLSEEIEPIKNTMGAVIDISFNCAGFSKTMSTALGATSPDGRVCLVGMGHNEMTIPLAPVAVREVDIVGIFRYKNTWPLCIEFLRSGKIDVKPLITHRFGFSQKEVEDASETSARGGKAIKVMFNL